MRAHIGHRPGRGLYPLRRKLAPPPVGQRMERLKIGVIEQRAMVQHAPLRGFLRAAGHLQAIHGDVAGAVHGRRYAQIVQRLDDRRNEARVIHLTVRRRDDAVIDVAQIVIDRAAAADAPNHRHAPLGRAQHIHLGERVLIAAAHHGGRIAPEHEDRLLRRDALKDIFLERLIEGGIVRIVFDIDHSRFSLPHRQAH